MIGFAGWMAATAAGLVFAAVAEPEDNPIFPPEATLELLFERTMPDRDGLTEGPAAAPDGRVYFSDIPGGPETQTTVYRFDPATGKVAPYTSKGSKANGLTFDAQGRLLVCDGANGGRRVVARWNIETGERKVLADRFDGKRLNSPNDLCVDRKGRIYFTDPRYGGSESLELKVFQVYRIDADGTLAVLTSEVEMPNGVVLSPDERTVYVGDYHQSDRPAARKPVTAKPATAKPATDKPATTKAAADQPAADGAEVAIGAVVYAFPLSDGGQIAGPRRTLVELGSENSCDGLTVDAASNVYITCRDPAKPGVLVVDAAGKRLAFFPTGPAGQSEADGQLRGIPSNVEFGVGSDSHTLYVTADTGFYRIRTKATGAPRVWEAVKP
ncbi:MAG TPA: SMP-30/gluconolactonase/LRE family protein [Pirellulales bacterium]|jgi:gluconolactonase